MISMTRALARKAAGLKTHVSVPEDLIAKVAGTTNNGKRYCKFCGRGPFTKAGLYQHLTKVHTDDLLDLIESYRATKTPKKHYESDKATISFKLDRELLEKLEEYVKANGLTKSEVIREALEEYLSKVGA